MSQPLADADRSRALDQIDQLLAARPDLRSTLETLYAIAWPETLILLAALPAPQDWPSADDLTDLTASPEAKLKSAKAFANPRRQEKPRGAGARSVLAGVRGSAPLEVV